MSALEVAAALQQETRGAGCTVAQLHFEDGPSPHWYGRFWPYVNVRICDFQGGKGWLVDGELELADHGRTQWNICRRHDCRDEAAAEATAFALHALELLERSLAGEDVVTPGQRRQQACEAAWATDPSATGLRSELDALEAELAMTERASARNALHALLGDTRKRLADALSRFAREFHASHHWSEFVADEAELAREAAE